MYMTARLLAVTTAALVLLGLAPSAAAQERLCDTAFENCRTPLLNLIRNEQQGIDVAFWFMHDARYVRELELRHQAGVPVRVLVDQRANRSHPANETILSMLRDAGIPMRDKYAGDILHFKMMLFHGQNVVQFSKANYSDASFVPITPGVNYFDEAIYFTNDDRLTNSFRRRFDDLWTNTSQYRNFANMSGSPVRHYPTYTIHPSMNFPPLQDFSNRSVSRYDREQQGIDAVVFRATDHRHADAMIRAVARGTRVRLITEPSEYRNPVRLWHSKHVDRMYMGGVRIKHRQHEGLMHQASVVMHGLGEVIFGSSNWTTASAAYQDEHNFFYDPSLGKPWFFQWFADQFEGKWNDAAGFVDFQPLPPGPQVYSAPSNGATGVSTSSVTLRWDGGTWAHLYDIYFGTDPNPPLVASNRELGSPVDGQMETWTVTNLLPGTTYYWRIVGKTWAQMARSGATWSFTTAGTPPDGGGTTPSGSTPYGGTPWAIPGQFEAENFDNGGQGVAYWDSNAGNSGGAYRGTDVDIGPASDSGGGFYVGWTRAGEWLKYTVNVATSGTYTLEARVANVGTGGRFHVEVDGVDRTGPIAVPDTGGWQNWQTIAKTGVSLSAGTRVVRVVFATAGSSGGVGNYNWFRLVQSSSSAPPPSGSTPYGGTPAPLPGIVQAQNFDDGGQGVAYSDSNAGNSGGVYRNTDVDINTTDDPNSAGYYVGWTRVGEWLKYTVNVAETRNYTLQVRVANEGTGATFRVEVDGVDRTGAIAVPNTGGWDRWQTVSVSGIPLSQGTRVIRLVMVSRNNENAGVGNYGYLAFQ
jgi:hypothetical protein